MTVCCSYCYQFGHNKRGCPDRKKRIEELRAANPDDYRVRDYDARKAAAARKSGNAKCSWCGANGHDRRRCGDFADARSTTKALQADLRLWFKQVCDENRISIGNIVTLTSRSQTEKNPYIMMLKKFDLDRVSLDRFTYEDDWQTPFVFKSLHSDYSYGTFDGVSLRRLTFDTGANDWRPHVSRVAPASAGNIGFPPDWISGETGLDELFKPSASCGGLRKSSFYDYYTNWQKNVEHFKTCYEKDLSSLAKVNC